MTNTLHTDRYTQHIYDNAFESAYKLHRDAGFSPDDATEIAEQIAETKARRYNATGVTE